MPVTSSETRVLDLQAGVDLEEADRAVLGRRGTRTCRRRRSRPPSGSPWTTRRAARAGRRSGTARAPPRRASGGGAAASSRGWRPRRRCRACRPGTGSRRGAACRGTSRRGTRRGRRRRRPRGRRTRNCSGISSIVRATLRPRPPPPKTALIATGRPCSSANATTSSASSTGSLVPGASGALAFCAMCLALALSPRRVDRRGRRADPDQPGVDDGLGEVGVLGEEAVAGVDGVGAAALGDGDDLLDREVGVAGRGAVEASRPRRRAARSRASRSGSA